MKLRKLLLVAAALAVLISQVLTMLPRGGGERGGGRGGGRGGRGGGHAARGGGRGGRAGGGRAVAARGAGRGVGRGGRGAYARRGGYGGWGRGGWGNAWGWGLFGGALLWTAPLWWQAGMYAAYSGDGSYVYVQPDAASDQKIQLAAWSITNNTPEPIQITSGNFSIEVESGASQDIPQTTNSTFNVTSKYNNQENSFTSKESNVAINDENGHTVMKNASMSKPNKQVVEKKENE